MLGAPSTCGGVRYSILLQPLKATVKQTRRKNVAHRVCGKCSGEESERWQKTVIESIKLRAGVGVGGGLTERLESDRVGDVMYHDRPGLSEMKRTKGRWRGDLESVEQSWETQRSCLWLLWRLAGCGPTTSQLLRLC